MNPIEKLIESFERFPGIGPRQARRFVQYLLSEGAAYRANLADTIKKLGLESRQCAACFRWFITPTPKGRGPDRGVGENISLCEICTDPHRDSGLLFVVEKDADIDNVERSGFKGLYFVLGGTIPLATDVPQKHVHMKELFKRIEIDGISKKLKEVILGLSATTEGDHTRLLLQEKMLPIAGAYSFKLSSLGRGLSTGSELEYADPDPITNALNSRN
ncbi:MAG: toprim domain-containing protein [bacterium]|nr:toprim domain-containing protein [bacterium]